MKIIIPRKWARAAGIAPRRKTRRVIPHRMVMAYCERCRNEVEFAAVAADVRIPGLPGQEDRP